MKRVIGSLATTVAAFGALDGVEATADRAQVHIANVQAKLTQESRAIKKEQRRILSAQGKSMAADKNIASALQKLVDSQKQTKSALGLFQQNNAKGYLRARTTANSRMGQTFKGRNLLERMRSEFEDKTGIKLSRDYLLNFAAKVKGGDKLFNVKRSLAVTSDKYSNRMLCGDAAFKEWVASSTTTTTTTEAYTGTFQTQTTQSTTTSTTTPHTTSAADKTAIEKWCDEATKVECTQIMPTIMENWGEYALPQGGATPFWDLSSRGLSGCSQAMHTNLRSSAFCSYSQFINGNELEYLRVIAPGVSAVSQTYRSHQNNDPFNFLDNHSGRDCFDGSITMSNNPTQSGRTVYSECDDKIFVLRKFCTAAQVDAVLAKHAEILEPAHEAACTDTPTGWVLKHYTDSDCTDEVSKNHADSASIVGVERVRAPGSTQTSGLNDAQFQLVSTQTGQCMVQLDVTPSNTAGGKTSASCQIYKVNITTEAGKYTPTTFPAGSYPAGGVDMAVGDIWLWQGFQGCDNSTNSNNPDTGDCDLSHWKCELGKAMCEAEDIGDWSNVCVTVGNTQYCATDSTSGYIGASSTSSNGQNNIFGVKLGSTTTCTRSNDGMAATTDGTITASLTSWMKANKVAATNDWSCPSSQKCDGSGTENKCNPPLNSQYVISGSSDGWLRTGCTYDTNTYQTVCTGSLCDTEAHDFPAETNDYLRNYYLSPLCQDSNGVAQDCTSAQYDMHYAYAWSQQCTAGGSPYSESLLSTESFGNYLREGPSDNIAGKTKGKNLYTKWVQMSAPAAGGGSKKSAAGTRLSSSLFSIALCTFAFLVHTRQ